MVIDLARHAEWGGSAEPEGATTAIPDPHFACDPLLVKGLLPALVARLSGLDPGGAATYTANARIFAVQLDALNVEIAAEMAPVKGAPVFLFHPSFNYFIKRYGLIYAGVIEPFPGKEPSPRYLQAVAQRVQQTHARAIFNETLLAAAPADVIAEAAGVKALELDPACGNSGHQYANYADWLRYNAGVFRRGLE
jgi:ABC-type Zn uptake system ZnuABC Zn-binding protein ZnuA